MRKKTYNQRLAKAHRIVSLACAFASVAGTAGLAADTTTNAVPTAKSAASAGLINDWLRGQSKDFNVWNLGGQIRLRYEMKENGGPFPNADFIERRQVNDNEYMVLRERLHLGYRPASWFNVFVEGQDASEHWDVRKPSPDADVVDLQQAFVEFGDLKQFPLSLKVGRQELAYGDERFVGRGDWSNTGRVFDVIKLRAEGKPGWIDGFVSHVVVPYDEHFNEDNRHDWFSGIYGGTRKLAPWQETQLYVLARNYSADAPNAIAPGIPASPKTARDIVTFGTLWKSLPGMLAGWDYSLESAGQLGSVNSSGQRLDQCSYAIFANLGYTWASVKASPRLGLGYEHGSGDSNSKDGTVETFENLFGTQHKPYGMMDLFGARNMHIPKLALSTKPLKGLTFSADYLLFIMANTHDYLYPESGSGRNANGYGLHPDYSSFVGSEVDVLANYSLKTWGNLQAGYGHFFPNDYVKQSVNSIPANGQNANADWFYAQFTFNF